MDGCSAKALETVGENLVPSGNLAVDVSSVPPRPAGAGRYAIELVSNISKLTKGIDLVSKKKDVGFWRSIGDSHVVVKSPNNRGARIVWDRIQLAQRLKAKRIPFYHGIHYTVPRGYSGRTITTIHDLTMIEHPEWHEQIKVRYFGEAIKRSIELADAIIVPSNFTRTRLEGLFGELDKITVIPHGVDHKEFSYIGDQNEIPLDDTRNLKYILHIGTIEPRKNIENLIKAFNIAACDDGEIELHLVGQKGWKSESIYAQIDASPYSGRIKLYGYLSENELLSELRFAGCVAYPSFAEGFGLPVLEAMAVGVPVVTSRDSVMEEVSGGFAYLCDPMKPDDIARQIRESMTVRNSSITQMAQRRSMDFTWEASAAMHLKVYQKVGFEVESRDV